MSTQELVSFVSEPAIRGKVSRLFENVKTELRELLPSAEIEHVGSTAIPGSLTKGDLDVQVRVAREDYADYRERLARFYSVNEGGFVADDATSFEDHGTIPPHGVHLTVIDGSCDIQWRFRDALLASAALRQAYDELKQRFDGQRMAEYRDAKEQFVVRVEASDVYWALPAPRAI